MTQNAASLFFYHRQQSLPLTLLSLLRSDLAAVRRSLICCQTNFPSHNIRKNVPVPSRTFFHVQGSSLNMKRMPADRTAAKQTLALHAQPQAENPATQDSIFILYQAPETAVFHLGGHMAKTVRITSDANLLTLPYASGAVPASYFSNSSVLFRISRRSPVFTSPPVR